MIELKNLNEIDLETKEGKLLVAALATLTCIRTEDIERKRWGPSLNAMSALEKLSDVANRMFIEKEYRTEKIAKLKERRRNKIIRN